MFGSGMSKYSAADLHGEILGLTLTASFLSMACRQQSALCGPGRHCGIKQVDLNS